MNERRTKFEICKKVFEELFLAVEPISFSTLRKRTGLGAESVREWIYLITWIQTQPDLITTQRGRNRYVELQKDDDAPTEFSKEEIMKGFDAIHEMLTMPESQLRHRIKLMKAAIDIEKV